MHQIFKQNTIYKWVEMSTATDPILDSKIMHKTYVNYEKLDEIGATLEISPRKSLAWLAQHTGVIVSSP